MLKNGQNKVIKALTGVMSAYLFSVAPFLMSVGKLP